MKRGISKMKPRRLILPLFLFFFLLGSWLVVKAAGFSADLFPKDPILIGITIAVVLLFLYGEVAQATTSEVYYGHMIVDTKNVMCPSCKTPIQSEGTSHPLITPLSYAINDGNGSFLPRGQNNLAWRNILGAFDPRPIFSPTRTMSAPFLKGEGNINPHAVSQFSEQLALLKKAAATLDNSAEPTQYPKEKEDRTVILKLRKKPEKKAAPILLLETDDVPSTEEKAAAAPHDDQKSENGRTASTPHGAQKSENEKAASTPYDAQKSEQAPSFKREQEDPVLLAASSQEKIASPLVQKAEQDITSIQEKKVLASLSSLT